MKHLLNTCTYFDLYISLIVLLGWRATETRRHIESNEDTHIIDKAALCAFSAINHCWFLIEQDLFNIDKWYIILKGIRDHTNTIYSNSIFLQYILWIMSTFVFTSFSLASIVSPQVIHKNSIPSIPPSWRGSELITLNVIVFVSTQFCQHTFLPDVLCGVSMHFIIKYVI